MLTIIITSIKVAYLLLFMRMSFNLFSNSFVLKARDTLELPQEKTKTIVLHVSNHTDIIFFHPHFEIAPVKLEDL